MPTRIRPIPFRSFFPLGPSGLLALGLCLASFPADAADATKTAVQVPKVAPGENLVAQGIPDIPAQLAEQVDRYTDFRSAPVLDWHPVRRELLVATRFGDTPQLHLLRRPGGARQQLTFYRDRVGTGEFNRGTGQSLVFSKDIGGGEFFQLYRYDLPTGEVTLLTDGKSRNTDPVYSASGKLIAKYSAQNGLDPAIVRAVIPRIPNEPNYPCHSALKSAVMTDPKFWPKKTKADLKLLLSKYFKY